MRTLKIALAGLSIAAGMEAQVPAQSPALGRGFGIANVPLVFFGAGNSRGNGVNFGQGLGQGLGLGLGNQQGWYWNSYSMRPYIYWNGNNTAVLPAGPSYANPGAVQPVGELPPPVVAPDNGKQGEEWADARLSFAAASAKVSDARRAVEELRARLRAIGQTPSSSLTSGASSAEAALALAKQRMEAGDIEESVREIQRTNYIAAQVLKQFGR